ncbi:MAG: GrpB family protein [Nocardioides sp.]
MARYDARWPADFARVATVLRAALADRVLEIHHVGSTSVPGLPAKPVIDVDLIVADPADETSYVPALVAAGFHHVVREPWWHEHRLLKYREPFAHVHVFGPDCPEVVRHTMFREWLLSHDDEKALYVATKRAAAAATTRVGGTGMDYNRVKEPVVRAIYDRMFRAHGLLD